MHLYFLCLYLLQLYFYCYCGTKSIHVVRLGGFRNLLCGNFHEEFLLQEWNEWRKKDKPPHIMNTNEILLEMPHVTFSFLRKWKAFGITSNTPLLFYSVYMRVLTATYMLKSIYYCSIKQPSYAARRLRNIYSVTSRTSWMTCIHWNFTDALSFFLRQYWKRDMDYSGLIG